MRKTVLALAILPLAFSACRWRAPATVGIDPALAALVPSDTTTLAGVKMETLRATPLYQRHVAGRQWSRLESFVRETGLDPRTDIRELLVASNGKHTMVMARGKFSPATLEARLEREGARRFAHRGHALIGNESGAVVFIDSTTALAGPPDLLRSVIDHRGGSAGVPAPLVAKVNSIPAESQVWAASLGDLRQIPVPEKGNTANLGRIAAMLQELTVAADLRAGLRLTAQGACADDKDAGTLETALRGLIGIARLSTPDDQPDLLRVYDAFKVSRTGNQVRLDADVPLDAFEKLVKSLEGGRLPGFSVPPGWRRPD